MNAINSFFINSTLVLSFILMTVGLRASDQIDYALVLSAQDMTPLLVSNTNPAKPEESLSRKSAITPPKTHQMMGRESITFILGKDVNAEIPFYDEAFYYFANHPYDQTEYIITSCRSLLDVRNYLASFPTGNALPWSTINVVLAPEETVTDLKVPVFPQGIKSSLKGLEKVAGDQDFPGLSSNQVDQYTTLYIHRAEVEKDAALNYALRGLLFTKNKVAVKPIFSDDNFLVETE